MSVARYTITWRPVWARLAAVVGAAALAITIDGLRWYEASDFARVLFLGTVVGVFIPSVRANRTSASDRGFVRRRPGRAWFALLGVASLAFVMSWWYSSRSMGVRAMINGAVYQGGCQCDQCVAKYGLVDRDPIPRSGCFVPPVTRYVWAQWMVGGIAANVALFMPVRKARAIARRADGVAVACMKCGYDMEGVPGAVCPECGADCRNLDAT